MVFREKPAEIHGQAVFTGESVGRQILRRRQRRRDSRERGYSFIVSKNPNSSDQMMVPSIIKSHCTEDNEVE
jgi:hypothetical protein